MRARGDDLPERGELGPVTLDPGRAEKGEIDPGALGGEENGLTGELGVKPVQQRGIGLPDELYGLGASSRSICCWNGRRAPWWV
jgi:hypothetical protein